MVDSRRYADRPFSGHSLSRDKRTLRLSVNCMLRRELRWIARTNHNGELSSWRSTRSRFRCTMKCEMSRNSRYSLHTHLFNVANKSHSMNVLGNLQRLK